MSLDYLRAYRATVTAAAAGNYTAGDAISQSATDNAGLPIVFQGMGAVLVRGYRAVCSEDDVRAPIRLHFFGSEPLPAEVEMDDNVAYSLKTSAGAAKWLGSIDLNAFRDEGAVAVSEGQFLNKALTVPHGVTIGPDIYCVPMWLQDESNESANMTIEFALYVL